jgi:CHASE2 domain-containing sensor protein
VKDFFVSYTSVDRSWAEWIAWRLEEAGYAVFIQAWDFRPGENFVVEMQQAAAQAKRTIVVLSEDYLKSSFGQTEWAAAFAQDPTGQLRNIVPVRVKTCEPTGLLRAIIFIDLVDVAEDLARQRLLDGLADRGKPVTPPPFPGASTTPAAPFPGPSSASPAPAEPAPENAAGAAHAADPPADTVAGIRRRRVRRFVRASAACIAASVVVMAACWVGLLSAVGADDWLERYFLKHMQQYLPSPDVRDIVVLRGAAGEPLGEPLGAPASAWRTAHGVMVQRLVEAGARLIVFDVDFVEDSDDDQTLANAIANAAAKNVPVVLGAREFDFYENGKAWPRIAAALANAPGLHWGTLRGGTKTPRIELAQRADQGRAGGRSWLESEAVPVVPSLALQAAMRLAAKPGQPVGAALRPGSDLIEMRSEAGRPPLKTVPVIDARLNFNVDVADDLNDGRYLEYYARRDKPGAFARFKDKIVVIGYEVPEEAWTPDDGGGKRWEMDIQASAIAQLLNGAYLRRLRPSEELLVVLGMAGLGFLVRAAFPSWGRHTLQLSLPVLGKPVEVPTVFLAVLVVYLLTAFLACKQLRIVPRFLYDVSAFLLSYYAVGWAIAPRAEAAATPVAPKAA